MKTPIITTAVAALFALGTGYAVAQFAIDWGPASSSTGGGLLALNAGASLTAVTVIVKLCVALVLTFGGVLLPLSSIRSVIVALPLAFAVGV